MKGIQSDFKLKNYKVEEPTYYLGATVSKIQNEDGVECWVMESDKYCESAVKNVEEVLKKKGFRLPCKCRTPFRSGFKPEQDTTAKLKPYGVQWYQEFIGQLCWAVEIGQVDILLEVALLLQHLALPREGHLEQDLHLLGYLKEHKKLRLMFNCGMPKVGERLFKVYDWIDFYCHVKDPVPVNMPEARGLSVSVSIFVDASHGGNMKDR